MISIIVPIFNSEKYLKKCVESILNQTYTDFELLLIDDGSSDHSYSICEKYQSKDNRIRIFSKPNKGQGAERNFGIQQSKGEFICFIDSDDSVFPNYLETLYKLLKEYDTDISMCEYAWVTENEEIVQPKEINILKYENPTDILQEARWSSAVGPCNKLYKKSLFDNIRYPEEKRHEDEFVIHHLFDLAKSLVYTNEKLYVYIKHKTSDVNNETWLSYYQGYEGLLDRVSFFHEKKDYKARNYWLEKTLFQLNRAVQNNTDEIDKSFYLPVFKQRMRELRREFSDCFELFYGKNARKADEILQVTSCIYRGPLISVIVAIYNAESHLKYCVDSLCRQTYENLEIILVNDGSTDHSLDICKMYEQMDSRIRVISQENGGAASARNTGLDVVKGEYIAFLDCDDYVKENYIETLLGNLLKNDTDLSICEFHQVHSYEQDFPKSKNECIYFDEPLYCLHNLKNITSVVVWNKLFKASLFHDVRFSIGKKIDDEFVMNQIYVKAKSAVYTKKILYAYVQHEGSVIHTIDGERYHQFYEVIKERFAILEEKNLLEIRDHWLRDYLNMTSKYIIDVKKNAIEDSWIPTILEEMNEICKRYPGYRDVLNNNTIQDMEKIGICNE